VLKEGCNFGHVSDTTRLLHMMPPGLDKETKSALLAKDPESIRQVLPVIPQGLSESERELVFRAFTSTTTTSNWENRPGASDKEKMEGLLRKMQGYG